MTTLSQIKNRFLLVHGYDFKHVQVKKGAYILYDSNHFIYVKTIGKLDTTLQAFSEEDYCIYFSSKDIQDISWVSTIIKPNIGKLYLNVNLIKDISIFSDINIYTLGDLSLADNIVEDIRPLSNLWNSKLYQLKNKIKDITPLSGMENLKYLYLSRNKIEDLSPLHRLKNLQILEVSDNGLPVEQLARLEKALPNCRISCGWAY